MFETLVWPKSYHEDVKVWGIKVALDHKDTLHKWEPHHERLQAAVKGLSEYCERRHGPIVHIVELDPPDLKIPSDGEIQVHMQIEYETNIKGNKTFQSDRAFIRTHHDGTTKDARVFNIYVFDFERLWREGRNIRSRIQQMQQVHIREQHKDGDSALRQAIEQAIWRARWPDDRTEGLVAIWKRERRHMVRLDGPSRVAMLHHFWKLDNGLNKEGDPTKQGIAFFFETIDQHWPELYDYWPLTTLEKGLLQCFEKGGELNEAKVLNAAAFFEGAFVDTWHVYGQQVSDDKMRHEFLSWVIKMSNHDFQHRRKFVKDHCSELIKLAHVGHRRSLIEKLSDEETISVQALEHFKHVFKGHVSTLAEYEPRVIVALYQWAARQRSGLEITFLGHREEGQVTLGEIHWKVGSGQSSPYEIRVKTHEAWVIEEPARLRRLRGEDGDRPIEIEMWPLDQ